MSCYIVPTRHISAIVRYAADSKLLIENTEYQACDFLYAANVRSVNARYNESLPEDGIVYDAEAPQLTAIQVLKANQGLAYQCDEWDGFTDSPANRFLNIVQRHAITQLPGYDAAPWSIE
jgi:hypothetical protein